MNPALLQQHQQQSQQQHPHHQQAMPLHTFMGWGQNAEAPSFRLPGMPHFAACGALPPGMLAPNFRPTQAFIDQHHQQEAEKEKRLVGTIKRFFGEKNSGYGFIDCEEAKLRYGYDVYIHARQMHRCEVGDEVSFSIVRNAKGEPQARNVCRLEDEERFLAKLQREQEKQQTALLQKRQLSFEVAAAPGGLMDEEQARRFQKSLKKL